MLRVASEARVAPTCSQEEIRLTRVGMVAGQTFHPTFVVERQVPFQSCFRLAPHWMAMIAVGHLIFMASQTKISRIPDQDPTVARGMGIMAIDTVTIGKRLMLDRIDHFVNGGMAEQTEDGHRAAQVVLEL